MINPQEIRIGNWINDEVLGFCQVTEIYKEAIQVAVKNLTTEGNIEIVYYTLHVSGISPIPLSPDVLEKCGFEKHKSSNEFWSNWMLPNGFYISQAHHSQSEAGVKEGCFYYGEDYTEMKNLHWLQGFYYYKTGGQELEYKP